MKRTFLSVILVIVLAFCLTACSCEHEWKEATCSEPKTCTLCEKTEGEAKGHQWQDATYAAPKTCTACGETEGVALVPSAEDSVFYNFNKAVLEEEFVSILGEPDEIEENYNGNSSLKRYYYYDVDLVGVKGKLTLEFYRFHVFTLRQAIFNVDGKSYQDKAQYGTDMTYLSQFFDVLYECKTDTDRQIWYNNFKDETVELIQGNTGFGFIYKHVD